MGKNSGSKSRPSLKGSGSLPNYFSSLEPRSSAVPECGEDDKMAPECPGESSVMKQDLLDLGADLKSYFDSLIAQRLSPIAQQLSDLKSNLKEVSSTAETTLEIGLTLQEDSKRFQLLEQQLTSRIALPETQARATNLKFRGFPEYPELNANLPSSIASWLAVILRLEDGMAPSILAAYRLGPPSAAPPHFPREVIIQFLYQRSRNAVLQAAHAAGPLKYEDHVIQVLLDLSPETLVKQRLLKPMTECLHRNKVRFRWSPTSDILVLKEGRRLRAEDISTGKDLLVSLDLPLPPDLSDDRQGSSPSRGEG